MNKFCLFIIIFISVYTNIYAQTWIPLTDEPNIQAPQIEIIESNANNYSFRVSIHGVYDNTITESQIQYHSLSVEGFQTMGNIGEPAFPIITQLIAIPHGKDYTVTISDTVWQDISIGDIYPFQSPMTEDEINSDFDISPEIYSSVSYFPDLVNYSELSFFKGVKNVTLSVCPFKYYPVSDQLSILKDFTVTVSFEETDDAINSTNPIAETDLYINLFDNYNDDLIDTYTTTTIANSRSLSSGKKDLLIIGSDEMLLESDILAKFCKWKAFKGIDCEIVSTSTTGSTINAIKSYIKNCYQNGIKNVLFIGDYDAIPQLTYTFNYKTIRSDYWYGCLDENNDYQSEIGIGRFCTNNLAELTNMINKTIEYEKNPPSGSELKKSLMIAHKEDAPEKYQECIEDICNSQYSNSEFEFVKAYGAPYSLGGNNATNSDIISYINSGVGIVNYRGHGDTTSWDGNWSNDCVDFNSTKVNLLTNSVYPVVFSIACLNGNIASLSKCLLEQFTKGPHGAVAFLGATAPSYTRFNHTFDKLIYESICNKNIYNIGEINNSAHILNISLHAGSNYAVTNAFMYLWGGDPTLELWTDVVNDFNIQFIKMGENLHFNTSNVSECEISMVTENGILGNILTPTSNYGVLQTTSPMYFIFNKHNYRPYALYYNPNDSLLQNQTVDTDAYFTGKNIKIGYNVNSGNEFGYVVVKNGTNVHFLDNNSVTIENGFFCEKGATLLIDP